MAEPGCVSGKAPASMKEREKLKEDARVKHALQVSLHTCMHHTYKACLHTCSILQMICQICTMKEREKLKEDARGKHTFQASL